MYPNQPENKQHYYGCITAMDEQIGRLRKTLKALNSHQNTMLWFCSDNGPARRGLPTHVGSAGPFRGHKGNLFEGGIRVPALLEWPAKITQKRIVDMPCSTLDYYPTIIDLLGLSVQNQVYPIDGISLASLLKDEMSERPVPIAFEHSNQMALIGNRFKLISTDSGKTFDLYDLMNDISESEDVSVKYPDVFRDMRKTLSQWRQSCKSSRELKDYQH
jgi:arylsulfatase A-like enzyme